MANQRTGTATIWKSARKIQKMVAVHGAADLESRTSTEFKDCVNALVTCVVALLASDDFVLEIDRHAPLGPEDFGGP